MDVAEGNTLADPYGGTVSPSIPRGDASPVIRRREHRTPDETPTAAAQIAGRHGIAREFLLAGDTVHYSGPNEWSFRRMVLHQAYLAKAAGGSRRSSSERKAGLTQVRSTADVSLRRGTDRACR